MSCCIKKACQCFMLFFLVLMNKQAWAFNVVSTPYQLYHPLMNTIAGNPNGDVTLVEFFDYLCSYCRKTPEMLTELVRKHPEIRVVYRDYPLLSNNSLIAAEAALAAQLTHKYFLLHTLFFTNALSLNHDEIFTLAERISINPTELRQLMLNPVIRQQLQENKVLANSLDIMGVPTFFVAKTPTNAQQEVNAYKLMAPSINDLDIAVKQINS